MQTNKQTKIGTEQNSKGNTKKKVKEALELNDRSAERVLTLSVFFSTFGLFT